MSRKALSTSKATSTKFHGFEPLTENYIYCPNQFFDVCLPHYSRSTVRLVAYMLRKTLGSLDKDGNPVEEILCVSYQEIAAARRKRREIAATFGRYNNSPLAEFRRVWVWPRRSLLTAQELATLWHPPTSTVQTDTRETTTYRRLEPPVGILLKRREQDAVTTLGRFDYQGKDEVFGLDVPARTRHVYVCGKTGVGKSTLLENQIIEDIHAGHGVGIIDPQSNCQLLCSEEIIKRRTPA